MEHPQQKRHFSEEETLEKIETKIDVTMEKIAHWPFVSKFLNHKFLKNILAMHAVSEINHKIQDYLGILLAVVGRVSLIFWIVGIYAFLVRLSELAFIFSLGLGIGMQFFIFVLFSLAFWLVSLCVGFGLVRHKKRVVALVALAFMISVVKFIICLIPVWVYLSASYASFWSGLFNLLITFVLLVLVLKNEHSFRL